jgi:hypothetical protein
MTDPQCLDCKTTSRGTCPVHADSDSVDLEIARLKAELERQISRGDHLSRELSKVEACAEIADSHNKRLVADLRAELSRLTKENRRLSEMVHKSEGMANEVNVLVKENRKLSVQLLAEEHARISIENHGAGPAEDEINRLKNALALVLLFHSGQPWSVESGEQWQAITGSNNATTKGMCDHIRVLLSTGDSE